MLLIADRLGIRFLFFHSKSVSCEMRQEAWSKTPSKIQAGLNTINKDVGIVNASTNWNETENNNNKSKKWIQSKKEKRRRRRRGEKIVQDLGVQRNMRIYFLVNWTQSDLFLTDYQRNRLYCIVYVCFFPRRFTNIISRDFRVDYISWLLSWVGGSVCGWSCQFIYHVFSLLWICMLNIPKNRQRNRKRERNKTLNENYATKQAFTE